MSEDAAADSVPRAEYGPMVSKALALFDEGLDRRAVIERCYGVAFPDEFYRLLDAGTDNFGWALMFTDLPWQLAIPPVRGWARRRRCPRLLAGKGASTPAIGIWSRLSSCTSRSAGTAGTWRATGCPSSARGDLRSCWSTIGSQERRPTVPIRCWRCCVSTSPRDSMSSWPPTETQPTRVCPW